MIDSIHKNNTPLSTIYVNANSASSTVTVSRVRGESVYVKHMDNDHGLYGAFFGGQSTFTGFLLQREYDDSQVDV
ncbi:hypothetical protein DPMN_134093 [Dreissena polymorpha]|uniref:Uncharacterized protein n=1 Tax=Dreissena polymorpha TaxID=45954 RepID=A0A9D4FZI1_DREPO|nr:hypothetical protein DPMN_134093 [Dreissena polymorpha]